MCPSHTKFKRWRPNHHHPTQGMIWGGEILGRESGLDEVMRMGSPVGLVPLQEEEEIPELAYIHHVKIQEKHAHL